MQPEQQQRIMGYFIEEAKEHLNTIEQGLLNLQSTLEDSEMTNELFRAAHSVKGGAAMLGLNSIQRVSHRLEDFFKIFRESPRSIVVDQELEGLFLQVFDALQELLNQLQGPFGLSEETANATVANIEPTFVQLEQHLEALAGGPVSAAESVPAFTPPEPVSIAAPTAPDSALQLIFGSDVPARLRDMLQLFKQPEADSASHQQLQAICRTLISVGEQFDLPDWCHLIETAQQAITASEQPYRTIAPIVIRDIKQAQELVLAGRASEISPCAQLLELVPLSVAGIADVDLADLLATTDLPDLTDSEHDRSLAIAAPLPDPAFDFGDGGSFDATFGSSPLTEQNGPEVGMAELNTLADLFEGEVPDLGATWQPEENTHDGSDSPIEYPTYIQGLEENNDFSDLLFEESIPNSSAAANDDLNDLFGDALFDDPVEPNSRRSTADDLDDLFTGSETERASENRREFEFATDFPNFDDRSAPELGDPVAEPTRGMEVDRHEPEPELRLEPLPEPSSPLDNLGELFANLNEADLTATLQNASTDLFALGVDEPEALLTDSSGDLPTDAAADFLDFGQDIHDPWDSAALDLDDPGDTSPIAADPASLPELTLPDLDLEPDAGLDDSRLDEVLLDDSNINLSDFALSAEAPERGLFDPEPDLEAIEELSLESEELDFSGLFESAPRPQERVEELIAEELSVEDLGLDNLSVDPPVASVEQFDFAVDDPFAPPESPKSANDRREAASPLVVDGIPDPWSDADFGMETGPTASELEGLSAADLTDSLTLNERTIQADDLAESELNLTESDFESSFDSSFGEQRDRADFLDFDAIAIDPTTEPTSDPSLLLISNDLTLGDELNLELSDLVSDADLLEAGGLFEPSGFEPLVAEQSELSLDLKAEDSADFDLDLDLSALDLAESAPLIDKSSEALTSETPFTFDWEETPEAATEFNLNFDLSDSGLNPPSLSESPLSEQGEEWADLGLDFDAIESSPETTTPETDWNLDNDLVLDSDLNSDASLLLDLNPPPEGETVLPWALSGLEAEGTLIPPAATPAIDPASAPAIAADDLDDLFGASEPEDDLTLPEPEPLLGMDIGESASDADLFDLDLSSELSLESDLDAAFFGDPVEPLAADALDFDAIADVSSADDRALTGALAVDTDSESVDSRAIEELSLTDDLDLSVSELDLAEPLLEAEAADSDDWFDLSTDDLRASDVADPLRFNADDIGSEAAFADNALDFNFDAVRSDIDASDRPIELDLGSDREIMADLKVDALEFDALAAVETSAPEGLTAETLNLESGLATDELLLGDADWLSFDSPSATDPSDAAPTEVDLFGRDAIDLETELDFGDGDVNATGSEVRPVIEATGLDELDWTTAPAAIDEFDLFGAEPGSELDERDFASASGAIDEFDLFGAEPGSEAGDAATTDFSGLDDLLNPALMMPEDQASADALDFMAEFSTAEEARSASDQAIEADEALNGSWFPETEPDRMGMDDLLQVQPQPEAPFDAASFDLVLDDAGLVDEDDFAADFAGLDAMLDFPDRTDEMGLDDLMDDEASRPAADDFDGLDSLLSQPPSNEPDFADLDNLLGAGAIAGGAAFGTIASRSDSQDDANFADLEALLEDEPAPPLVSIPEPASVQEADRDAGFDELDALLKDAEEKMGGAAALKTSRSSAPQTRRATRPGRVFSEQTMRVPVKHLDNLSNLVGELVVNRNSLEQDQERLRQSLDNLLYQVQQLSDVGQRMQDLYERSLLESSLLASRQSYRLPASGRDTDTSTQLVSSEGVEYDPLEMDRFTGFHSLSQEMIELIVRVRESASDIEFVVDETDQVTRMFRQVTTQLQEGLTRSRMVPFAQTADRLPRAVRDISMKVGKQVELQIEGRETLIDKMILEQLYDPMTHLVNNALTHGIESPDVRRNAGKSPAGRIVIRAFHQGNQTIISVSDDGAGIDVERVKTKAIEKGLITPAEARSMTRLDVYDLLFQAGFSTKDQADDFSGRGVGMDVVRTSLSEIRGVINTDSTPGKGTTFTIRLPLTLSISKALCCISDRARIAFPMDGVEDMLDVPKERIQLNGDAQPCIAWRDSLLPLRPLADLLGYSRHLSRGTVYGGNQEDDIVSIVVLRSAGNFLALQVDQVLGEQEIVIKQLEGPVPKPVGVAGATVLGDGRIMPIADVLELIDLSMGRIRRDVGGPLWEQGGDTIIQEVPVVKTEPMVLIVDDSITVRELLSMTFNKVGYRVEQARDGQEAWEKLRAGLPCDIVFCDIEMPRMDGLELLSRIQKDSALAQLPIAMLTSRGADRHRQMASSLGASGYFTKPYLEEALLDAAQRMLKGEKLL